MPYIQQVAVGRLPELNVYGHDYPTKDGSAVCKIHGCCPNSLFLAKSIASDGIWLSC